MQKKNMQGPNLMNTTELPIADSNPHVSLTLNW